MRRGPQKTLGTRENQYGPNARGLSEHQRLLVDPTRVHRLLRSRPQATPEREFRNQTGRFGVAGRRQRPGRSRIRSCRDRLQMGNQAGVVPGRWLRLHRPRLHRGSDPAKDQLQFGLHRHQLSRTVQDNASLRACAAQRVEHRCDALEHRGSAAPSARLSANCTRRATATEPSAPRPRSIRSRRRPNRTPSRRDSRSRASDSRSRTSLRPGDSVSRSSDSRPATCPSRSCIR